MFQLCYIQTTIELITTQQVRQHWINIEIGWNLVLMSYHFKTMEKQCWEKDINIMTLIQCWNNAGLHHTHNVLNGYIRDPFISNLNHDIISVWCDMMLFQCCSNVDVPAGNVGAMLLRLMKLCNCKWKTINKTTWKKAYLGSYHS